MAAPITRIPNWADYEADMIIDVRAPSEYADDHIPGAINLPVMNDAERAEIGTMYKQESPFVAKRAGAAVVARNIATHLETVLADAPRHFKPLVYCWRGGQRSGSMARIFSEIGWHTGVIEGGYKAYRKSVLDTLDAVPPSLPIIILRGRTGTAKTHILRRAAELGAQIIDLEGLASHRGSLLGPEPDRPQPSQRQFESDLTVELSKLDSSRPVFIEAESNKVGQIHIPAVLWAAMREKPTVTITADVGSRAAFLQHDYAHIIADPVRLDPLLQWGAGRLGHKIIDEWRSHIAAGNWGDFVESVLIDHYDPAYDRSSKSRDHHHLLEISGGALDPSAIEAAAAQLAQLKI